MPNLKIVPEGRLDSGRKQSLYLPASPPTPTPFPRSLVGSGNRAPTFPVGATAMDTSLAQVAAAERRAVADEQPRVTRELPAEEWRADLFTVTPLGFTWLDSDVGGFYMPTRRSITVINHDPAAGIWLRHTSSAVIRGCFIAASGNISLPLGPGCKVYAQGIAAGGSNLTFIQLGG